jgi:hypothetical protein
MILEDLRIAERDSLVHKHGYSTYKHNEL